LNYENKEYLKVLRNDEVESMLKEPVKSLKKKHLNP